MKVVIMAGGEGTRLRPLTCGKPKPMVPLANRPVMEHIVKLVKKHNLTDIAVTLQYMPEVIKDYFQDGSEFGVNMSYYIESTPLGTAGSVKNAEEFLDDTFIVISGDALTDVDLTKVMDFHIKKGAIATLVLKRVDVPLEYGIVVVDEEGKVVRFLEKPSWGEVFSDTANTGIYVLNPEVLDFFEKNEIFDFSKDLFPIILRKGLPMYGYITEDYWCDIGDLRAYAQAHMDVLSGNVKVNIPGKRIMDNIWVEDDVSISENATVKGPCIIGYGSSVEDGALIDSFSVIGEGCSIDERVSVKRGIIWKNCIIEKDAEIRGSILGNKVHIKNGASVFEHAVIGDGTVVGERGVVKPAIKVWPGKIVDAGAEVNSNMVWGARYTKSIFGHRGIAGEINVDITPEFASKLGAAYGTTFKNGAKVAISSDNSNCANMLKMSFAAGILSSGVEVFDMGRLLLPMARSGIRFYKLNGGIHISTSTDDEARLFIDFLEGNGATVGRSTERKIENAFIREDFKRSSGKAIKRITPVFGVDSFYRGNILNSIKSEKLFYKVVINSRSDFVTDTLKELLLELGCQVDSTKLKIVNTSTRRELMTSNEIDYFTGYVRMSRANLGVSVEETAEKMILVDELGRVVSGDRFTALASLIVFKNLSGGTAFVPVSSSNVIEKIAREYNGRVVRTKTSEQDMMSKLLDGNPKGGALEQFALYFDAIAGLIRILDFMNVNGYKLSQLVDMIPEIHIRDKTVQCPWEAKGRVIRELMQQTQGHDIETLEGVKIFHEGGWVLVLPDTEKPLCRVIGEGYSEEYAEELTGMYVQKVLKISGEGSRKQ